VKDPAELTLTELAGALRRRTFSSTELTGWMLERIGRWQPAINAFVRVEEDEALAAAKRADRALARGKAKGALCGVPLAHKDMYYMKGKLSECGSKVRKGLDRAGDLNRTDAARRRRIVSYRRAAYVGVRL
jgi:aspartyl-tRNA(Asn)/glutamyl-tRNA(Gln) amidotransferase subunit A